MKEQEVERICGKPDEIRMFSGEGLHEEAYRWAYGISKPGSFTTVGIVLFNKQGTVIHASCPARRAEVTGRKLITEATTDTNRMNCLIEAVWENESISSINTRQFARVSLVNRGYQPWVFWGRGELYDNLLIEVYDSKMNLLFSVDQADGFWGVHNAMPARALRLEPLTGICREFPIFLSDLDYGKPDPGVYFLRVAFPLEEGKRYASNLHRFQIR